MFAKSFLDTIFEKLINIAIEKGIVIEGDGSTAKSSQNDTSLIRGCLKLLNSFSFLKAGSDN